MKNTVFPHKFWRPFLDCMPQLFFRPQYVWFPVHLKGHLIPLCYETLVVNWQNWLFTLFHQSRSVLSPTPILYRALKEIQLTAGLGRVHKSWVRVRVRVLCLAWVRVRVLKKCVSTSTNTSTLVWVRVRVRVLHLQSTKFMSISLTFFRNNLLSNFAGISGPLY